jgi:hypothetical protein
MSKINLSEIIEIPFSKSFPLTDNHFSVTPSSSSYYRGDEHYNFVYSNLDFAKWSSGLGFYKLNF